MKNFFWGVLAVALFVIWGITATANFVFASEYGGGDGYAVIFGIMSACADLFKVGAAIGFVIACLKRKPINATVAAVVWIATASWSIYCLHSFAATNFMASVEIRADENRGAKRNIDSMEKLIKNEGITLSALQIKGRPKKEVDEQRQHIAELRKELALLPSGDKEVDPTGAAMEASYGASKDAVRKWTIIGFLIVMEIMVNLGYAAFHPHWSEMRRKKEDAPPQVATPERPTVSEAPKLVVDNVRRASIPRPRHVVTTEDFIERVLREHSGERVWTRDLQDSYVAWCEENDIEILSTNHLGHALSRRGVKRSMNKDSAGRYYYSIPAVA